MTLFAHLFEDHAKYEFIRTIDSMLSVILQVTTLAVQMLWSMVDNDIPTLRREQ